MTRPQNELAPSNNAVVLKCWLDMTLGRSPFGATDSSRQVPRSLTLYSAAIIHRLLSAGAVAMHPERPP